METKKIPFTLEKYIQKETLNIIGLETRTGRSVEILKTDLDSSATPIVAVVDNRDITKYSKEGKTCYGNNNSSYYDLFMIVEVKDTVHYYNLYENGMNMIPFTNLKDCVANTGEGIINRLKITMTAKNSVSVKLLGI